MMTHDVLLAVGSALAVAALAKFAHWFVMALHWVEHRSTVKTVQPPAPTSEPITVAGMTISVPMIHPAQHTANVSALNRMMGSYPTTATYQSGLPDAQLAMMQGMMQGVDLRLSHKAAAMAQAQQQYAAQLLGGIGNIFPRL